MPTEKDSVIRSYLLGDQSAFQELIDLHTPALRSLVARRMAPLLRRRVSVHDVLQEVSIFAFERRAEFTGSTSDEFKRWLRGIAANLVHAQVNHHGTHKRALHREVSRGDDTEPAEPRSPDPSPSQLAVGAELEQLAAEALEQLPPDYRNVLVRHRENKGTLAEIATSMGRTPEAVTRLHGRAMVRFSEQFDRLRGERR